MADIPKNVVLESEWDDVVVPAPSRAPAGKLKVCVELVKRLIAETLKPSRPKKKKQSPEVVCAGSAADFAPRVSSPDTKKKKRIAHRKGFDPETGTLFSRALDLPDAFFEALRHSKTAMKKMRNPPRMRMMVLEPAIRIPEKPVPPDLHAPVLSFAARLLTYVNEKCDGVAPVAYKRVGISRQIYSRIVSRDDSTVNKRTAMLFCIGLQLNMQEAELLLKSAGYAFSGTLPEDRIITWCIENRVWNIDDINEIFRQCSLRPFKP